MAVGTKGKRIYKATCTRCEPLAHAPPCLACGKRVRGASYDDPNPYHELCRRCSSCSQVVPKKEMVKLAGHLLCGTCDHLFGRFFLPTRQPQSERMKEAFQAWDRNNSGSIEVEELKGVMKGLNPDFPDRDLDKIMRVIDTNHNGVIEYEEFVEWVMGGSSLEITEDSFEGLVSGLMRDAGSSSQQNVAEVLVQPAGLFFRMRSGEEKCETYSIRNDSVELCGLDPEEFISKVEFTEQGLLLSMNSGRVSTLKLKGQSFGPWVAPEGFHVVGFRTKPAESDSGEASRPEDRVVGLDFAPLPEAKSYDAAAALRYSAENEYLYSLRAMLSKAAVDVNSFSPSGVTALMLAAQHGNVGSMRLLIGSKAKVDLEDYDGWTALTFASRFGHTSAVDLLVEKGAGKASDNSSALTEALRHAHNSAARALLRAGFGPAPAGTFALEELMDESKFKLPPPVCSPAGSVFPGPVTVELFYNEPEKKADEEQGHQGGQANEAEDPSEEAANPQAGDVCNAALQVLPPVRILYTLDGRDPFLVGKRYRGPLTLTAARTNLRFGALQGKMRSKAVNEVFVVCHYTIPEDVITGSFQIRAFPEARDAIQAGLAAQLKAPIDRISTEIAEATRLTNFGTWIRIPVSDPKPKHALKVERSFAQVRGKDKQAAFVQKLCDDFLQAVGVKPGDVSVAADHRGGRSIHRAGCIGVEFTMPREKAEQVAKQLADDSSFLLTQGRLRVEYLDSKIELVRPMGDRLADRDFKEGLMEALRKAMPKQSVKDVLGVGKGDAGTVGVAVSTGAKIPLPALKKVIVSALIEYPAAMVGQVEECAEELVLKYTIDVISAARGSTLNECVDASTVVKELNSQGFSGRLTQTLTERKLPLQIFTGARATSRSLSKLEFHLEWAVPEGAASGHCLDGICMIYSGSQNAEVIDFRSSMEAFETRGDEADSKESLARSRSIARAVHHSGDRKTEQGGEHRISMDLDALPLSVTDLFFVIAASESRFLSQFRNTRVRIHDVVLGRLLTEYSIASAGQAQAVVMCSLTKDADHSKWVVHGLGIPTAGTVKDYEPIRKTLAGRQASYLRWEQRKHIVLLRALRKRKRMTQHATNEFARFMWRVLDLPISAFQGVVEWL